jgi:hypothetical protein
MPMLVKFYQSHPENPENPENPDSDKLELKRVTSVNNFYCSSDQLRTQKKKMAMSKNY